jgi:hypothetical protein
MENASAAFLVRGRCALDRARSFWTRILRLAALDALLNVLLNGIEFFGARVLDSRNPVVRGFEGKDQSGQFDL